LTGIEKNVLKNPVIAALVIGIIAGAVTAYAVTELRLNFKSENDLIKDFYLTENAVHVSPHSIRKAMGEGNDSFILVDLRSQEEYEEFHIRGAVSIPAYKDRDTSDYGARERIISSFASLPKDKEIIVYCYSMPCMTGRKIGKMLAENNIYVKHLGIGWNEWKNFWTLWNHEHEWATTNVEDYLWSGSEPGTPLKEKSSACPIQGEFGC